MAMDMDRLHRLLFVNPRFSQWFPECRQGTSLGDCIPDFDGKELDRALAQKGAWQKEIEVKSGRRAISLALQITRREEDQALALECINVSKIKELEYMIESYSKMIERQNRDLTKEKERVERLLLNIMPKPVYEEWKVFGVTSPQRFDEASILMLDFVDSTQMAVSQDPQKLIAELNDMFTAFDRICEQFGCERLKTQGDAYIAVSGIPEPSPDHARNIANVALRFVRYLKKRNKASEFTWRCRIGIHSGPVIAGVIGHKRLIYDLWGDTVNTASRMESHSEPGYIQLTDDTRRLLGDDFDLEPRGVLTVKDKGLMNTWFLRGKKRG